MINFGAQSGKESKGVSKGEKFKMCHPSATGETGGCVPRQHSLLHRNVSRIGMKNRDVSQSKLGKGTVSLLASLTDRWTHSNP